MDEEFATFNAIVDVKNAMMDDEEKRYMYGAPVVERPEAGLMEFVYMAAVLMSVPSHLCK